MAAAGGIIFFIIICTSQPSLSTPACGVRGPSTGVAGARVRDPSSQIVGGEDARPLEFPWQVSVQLDQSSKPTRKHTHICGGSIIHEQHVITAAQCIASVLDPSFQIAVVGEYDLDRPDPHERSIEVSSVAFHPYWRSDREPNYDYVILKLKTPLNFSGADSALMPICLPEENQEFDNQTCTASGWGFKTPGTFTVSEILQKVDLPVVPHEQCRLDYLDSNPVVRRTMICAGVKDGTKTTCVGDNGGPLQCARKDGRYVLAGISSWGGECGAPNQPSVFARVSTQLRWIESVAGATP